ncbi:MAG: uracil-DNA glycosylase [Bacteroidota bacterium]
MSNPTTDAAAKVQIEDSWKQVLRGEFSKAYFQQLKYFLLQEKKEGKVIYPAGKNIFHAFNTTPFDKVKVVVIGQDPYHGPGQAHGLSFSVQPGVAVPPSLRNIYKELQEDVGFQPPNHGFLDAWAQQGVLMLNAILTVRHKEAGSHRGKGWELFTDAAIKALNDHREKLVFLLWGSFAQQKGGMVDETRHLVLKAAHPSPFAAHKGFFGCRHFSKTNEYVQLHGQEPIDWQL